MVDETAFEEMDIEDGQMAREQLAEAFSDIIKGEKSEKSSRS